MRPIYLSAIFFALAGCEKIGSSAQEGSEQTLLTKSQASALVNQGIVGSLTLLEKGGEVMEDAETFEKSFLFNLFGAFAAEIARCENYDGKGLEFARGLLRDRVDPDHAESLFKSHGFFILTDVEYRVWAQNAPILASHFSDSSELVPMLRSFLDWYGLETQ